MNYSIISINQTTANLFSDLAQDTYLVRVKTIHDDCFIYLNFICGSKFGAIVAVDDDYYLVVESYPDFDIGHLIATLLNDFPHIIDHNQYVDTAKKASLYLAIKGISTTAKDSSVFYTPNPTDSPEPDIILELTRKDIEYFAELYDESNQ